MKKLSAAFLLSVLSLPSYAALYSNTHCSLRNVSVPCEGRSWVFGIDGLYIKNRVNIYTQDTPDYNAHFGLGSRLEGAYLYGQGHDMAVNWTYSSRSKDQVKAITVEDTALTVDTTLDSRINIFNVEMGQHIDIAKRVDMRVHGGLEYALLNSDPKINLNNILGLQVDAEYQVRGFGPRVGLDLDFNGENGFGLFLHSSLALLRASLTTSGTVSFTPPGGRELTFSELGKEHVTVAATEMRGGLKYTHQFNYGDLTIRGGYQAHNFNNARSRTSNLSWDGGFVGVSWLGFA